MASSTSAAKRSLTNITKDEIYRSQSLEQSLTPPETPPGSEGQGKIIHPWPEPDAEDDPTAKRRKVVLDDEEFEEFSVEHQNVLLLHAPKQRYAHTEKHPVPSIENDREMLVAVDVVGLNPIDWKAPDFGWGLPALPCISGRDLAGRVVKTPTATSRFRRGDTVMAISTDYRDNRKAAYQQYAIVSDFNACRLPYHLSSEQAAPLGVAFVAAALSLGICMGLDFGLSSNGIRGPNILQTVQALSRDALPKDIQAECFDSIKAGNGAKPGDWIVIWGGSSASGCCAVQLAKLSGLKVIAIIDVARNGERMLKFGADLLVDRHNEERAIEIVKSVTKGKLRFALDTRGKESAKLLADAMQAERSEDESWAHLVGLTGLPKEFRNGVVYHSVPIKAFHEAPEVGEGLMVWLEKLLDQKLLITPDIEVAEGGLEGINAALDKLRDGTVNGPRIVVPISA
ncbi:related to oxidoreductase [Phialocephala subalpina]|uniref:Related to oxidoreductase n=1 Tax=Phialocephala subalpina TaxID=576137 RepID=A0A1L7XKU2_9HELO|nr:related to oxidoreductase [Phialocephala subalpina]